MIVSGVRQGSIGEEIGIEVGSQIIEINGEPLEDLVQYELAIAEGEFTLTIEDPRGEVWEVEVERDEDEDMGILFSRLTKGPIRACANRCRFCFIDQLPSGLRQSLHVKDDDYRLSFLQGSYITLTNLREADWQRILQDQLSPLYVSVHATDPGVRSLLMGNPRAGEIRSQLKRLTQGGIRLHTQIVLCPGYNDGQVLEETLADLAGLGPRLLTVSVVPVGLTHLASPELTGSVTPQIARAVIDRVGVWQERLLAQRGTRTIFCGDEFYLRASLPIPPEEEYEGFPLMENGVGLIRHFLSQWEQAQAELPSEAQGGLTLVTGEAMAPIMEAEVLPVLQGIPGLTPRVEMVKNQFFGGDLSVAGLLTAQDLLHTLDGKELGDLLILPAVMFRESTDEITLDGLTRQELAQALKTPIALAQSPWDLVELVQALSGR